MSQENDHDFRDQHKILVLEMLTNPGVEIVTKILLHSVIHYFKNKNNKHNAELRKTAPAAKVSCHK